MSQKGIFSEPLTNNNFSIKYPQSVQKKNTLCSSKISKLLQQSFQMKQNDDYPIQSHSGSSLPDKLRYDAQRLVNLTIDCKKKSNQNKKATSSKITTTNSSISDSPVLVQGSGKLNRIDESLPDQIYQQLLLNSNEQLSQQYELQTTNPVRANISDGIFQSNNIQNSMDDDESQSSQISIRRNQKDMLKDIKKQKISQEQNCLTSNINKQKKSSINTSIFYSSSKQDKNQFKQTQCGQSQIQKKKSQKSTAQQDSINTVELNMCVESSNKANKVVLKQNKSQKNQSQNDQSDQFYQFQQTQKSLMNQSKKTRFTPEQDATLMNLFAIHGKKWRVISELIGGKNDTQIRNKYYSYIRKQQKLDDNQNNEIPQEENEVSGSENSNQINNEQQHSQLQQEKNDTQSKNTNKKKQSKLNAKKQNKNEQISKKLQGSIKSNLKDTQDEVLQSYNDLNNNNKNKSIDNISIQNHNQSRLNNLFFNSTLLDSLNILTANNFDKDYNRFNFETNQFQFNNQDQFPLQSNQQLINLFSSNNLNDYYQNQLQKNKLTSFQFLKSYEGSLGNLDRISNQQFANKDEVQEYPAIESEEYNQKYFSTDNINNQQSSVTALPQQNNETPYQQPLKQLDTPQKLHSNQYFCPNKILIKSNTDYLNEEPSPLVFAKVNQRYDSKRFLNLNIQKVQNTQSNISKFSIDDDLIDHNITSQPTHQDHSQPTATKSQITNSEKIEKISFLNSQVDNISLMIEQCKQEILKEIMSKKLKSI